MVYKKFFLLGLIFLIFLIFTDCHKKEKKRKEEISFEDQKQLAEGTVLTYKYYLDSLNSEKEARLLLVEKLKKTQGVKAAGLSIDSTTIWWKVEEGIEYCLLTQTKASLTDTTDTTGFLRLRDPNQKSKIVTQIREQPHLPHNQNALILSPYAWDWKLFGIIPLEDETKFINDILSSANYSTVYKLNSRKEDQNISMDDYKRFNEYGVIVISSHGGVTSRGEVCIATGVIATPELYKQYKQDLINGNLVLVVYIDKWFTNKDILAFAFTPGWVAKYYPQKLTNTFFYASVCEGLFNNTMANKITGKGTVYFGWTHNVDIKSAVRAGKDLFTQLVPKGLTCGEAHIQVINNGNGEYHPPIGPISYFQYVGDSELCLVERPLRIAVTPAGYDDVGRLLTDFGYNVTTIGLEDLLDSAIVSQYDIIAINCDDGLGGYAQGAKENLRRFVSNGGHLYASDWAFVFVETAFPEFIEFPSDPYIGDVQTVIASVVDTALASYLGVNQVTIEYDLPDWVVIDTISSFTNVLLVGDVSSGIASGNFSIRHTSPSKLTYPLTMMRPLAVNFNYGNGTVVYTTFHNEAQISEPVRHILEYFIIIKRGRPSQ